MKPTTSPYTNSVFKLPGGTEENDLPAERTTDEAGRRLIISTWQPDDAERAAIMAGSPIELIVWGDAQPPVAVAVADAIPPSTADDVIDGQMRVDDLLADASLPAQEDRYRDETG